MFTFTNNFILLSTSNNSDSFISNSNFCFCQHQFVVYSTPNSKVCLLQPTSISVFVTYFVYFFLNSLTQPFCLNFQHPFRPAFSFFLQPCVSATQQPIPLFVFATFHQQATIQLIFFLATSLPTAFFCFLLSSIFNSFIVLFPSPPVFFGSDVLFADRPSWRGAM